jgi:ABC-type branched-subunit amino acid transport system substrate-binding protein
MPLKRLLNSALFALPLLSLILAGCAGAPLARDAAGAARAHGLSVSADEEASYQRLLKESPASPQAGEARYFVAQAAFNRGEAAKAQALFEDCARQDSLSGWGGNAAFMAALCLERQSRLPEALAAYEALQGQAQVRADILAQARQNAERLIRERFDLAGLAALAASHAAGPDADLIHSRLVEEQLKSGDLAAFFSGVDEHRSRFPGSPLQAGLDSLVGQAYRKVPIKPRVLGLMLPGSGRAERYASEALNGVQLAFDEANTGLAEAERYSFVQVDEGSNSLAAGEAARRLVEQERVVGILGPLFSDPCEGAISMTARSRVPVMSPSAPRAGLGQGDPFFFRNCITPEKGAREMADYAMLQQRFQRLGVLYPDTAYGRTLAQAFQRRVADLGGTVAASVSYTAGSLDFKDAMLALGGTDPNVAKDAEVEGRKEQQAGVEKACSNLAESILAALRVIQGPEPEAVAVAPKGVPTPEPTPALRLAVLDFACDSASASFKAGRALSDRFWRTLGSLADQGLDLKGPNASFEYMAARRMAPEALNPSGAAEVGRGLGARLVLAGSVAEVPPDWDALKAGLAQGGAAAAKAQKGVEMAGKVQVFGVSAQIIDALSGSIVATAGFDFTKLRPLPSNTHGLQAIYLPARDPGEVVQIAPNLEFYELKLPLLGADTWHSTELLREAESLEGACFTTAFFAGSARPEVERFVKAYQDRYAARPGEMAAQAYDAASIMLGCLRHGAATREDLRDALAATRGFLGVSGETSFDSSPDAVKKLPILEVKGGDFIQVQ